ncbi:MAG: hypothetical protein KTR20_14590 [Cellvibrionaceae bacterium]|nr:hypothetical protein [Cellvibrionaceae bacterium]
MVKKYFLLFVLMFSLPITACANPQNRTIYCEKSACNETAKKIIPIKKGSYESISYYTGYGFLIDIYSGFNEVYEALGGVTFRYNGKKKEVALLPINWTYNNELIKFSQLSGSFDNIAQIDRDDISIYYYDSDYNDDDPDLKGIPFFEVLITHKNMPDNKAYSLLATGFSETELQSLLSSIQLGNPYKQP